MKDLNARIKQLTNLILTSQTVDENRGDESRPASPSKVDFDMTPYQVRILHPSSPLIKYTQGSRTHGSPSSNKSSSPRGAKSNLKRRKSSRSKQHSSRVPSCHPMHRKARRIGCWWSRHAPFASSRWSSRGTRIISARRCAQCARTSSGNGARESRQRKQSARKRMRGQRSSHAHSRRRKRFARTPSLRPLFIIRRKLMDWLHR
jgi:hypothetical protein